MTLRGGLTGFARSLRGRLILSATLFILLSMLIVGIVVGKVFERFVRGEVEARLDTQIAAIAAAFPPNRPPRRERDEAQEQGPDRDRQEGRRFDHRRSSAIEAERDLDRPPFDRPGSGWYWQVEGPDGLMARAASLGEATLSDDLVPEESVRGRRARRPSSAAEDAGLIVRSRRVEAGGRSFLVLATAPKTAVSRPLRDASLAVALPIGLCGLLLVGAIALQVRFGLAPLEALRASLAAVRSGERERVPPVEAAELRPLVEELNALIEQDAANLKQARRHVANLAHGLKTPLATLSAALERMPGAAERRDLNGSIELMDRRIRHHLRRARTAALDGHVRYRTDLKTHAEDLGAVIERLSGGRGLTVSVDVPADLLVAVEPEDLDEMLGNLLDNASRFAVSRMRLTAGREARVAVVAIEDDGPGLSASEIEAVMQPGRRLDETSPGHGFGLPITSELAELYAGSLVLDRGARGGLRAELRLPVALTAA